ncbi:DUF5685 family protein [Streptomyces beihaiensis]|uniref:DUF5685 family protein n=1 Tax=Streptomyces beihaiensis TaxID=2984495 RepID=A0ABT3U1D3_9ACTN|nr:DUF5685 family protein [Streptomyces beihaiensis]MCX3063127.1 DUF5685 family protein [Streptomyces beihaiensis]
MFGIVRPCGHRLGEGLKTQWMAHLCGLCLALRGDHGQFARIVTNYDGLLVSVLTEAQSERSSDRRRRAGPCPLRGMRTASVAQGEGARLAAAVSLVLASAKVRDHVDDRDGLFARRPVAAAARKVAANWGRAGARTGTDVGFDTAVLLDAVERQTGIEALAGPGTSLLTVTEPTETATAAAFAHTAVLAGRPGNAEPLAEAGRLFGRLAHLLDAVEDLANDTASGAWNPLTATGTDLAEARRLADDAVHGVRLALREADFVDGRLAHLLLAHELGRSVDRVFGTGGCVRGHVERGEGHGDGRRGGQGGGWVPTGAPGSPYAPTGSGSYAPGNPYASGDPYGGGNPYAGGGTGGPGGPAGPGGPGGGPSFQPPKPGRRGFWAGCFAAVGLCCTCKVCCADEFEGPWSRKKRGGLCDNCDDCCDCCEYCEVCQCCECLDCCDCCDC